MQECAGSELWCGLRVPPELGLETVGIGPGSVKTCTRASKTIAKSTIRDARVHDFGIKP